MLLSLMASQFLLDTVIDALSIEVAIRYMRGAPGYIGPTLPQVGLGGGASPSVMIDSAGVGARRRSPGVRVIIDRWILELVQDLIESTRPNDVRGFIEEAVLAYVDRLAATGYVQ